MGHLISDKGIHPLPEKLYSICNIPKLKNPKEINSFLVYAFITGNLSLVFLDILRPMTKLKAHNAKFEWSSKCDLSFKMLKDALCSAPILKYLDTFKPYTIFTDANRYGWAGVLTQEHSTGIDGKEVTTNNPVSFVSGLFCGSQLNWAVMTKRVYATYITVKKSTFHITGHQVTLRTDHLPLNKYLSQMTLNNTVNNWATEIESFKIEFIHIASKDNILTDTISRLIDIDPDIVLGPELKDYEFGQYAFEKLTKAKSTSVGEKLASVDGIDICEIITYDNPRNSQFSIQLPLSNRKFACLQEKDAKICQLWEKVKNGLYMDFYFIKNDILYSSEVDNGHKFNATVVPEGLIGTVLHLGHNQSGHNDYQRTYTTIKCIYYWKGMRKHILVHCKSCVTCTKQKLKK